MVHPNGEDGNPGEAVPSTVDAAATARDEADTSDQAGTASTPDEANDPANTGTTTEEITDDPAQVSSSDTKTLESALEGAKLNASKWSTILERECGVTEYGQLEYLDKAALRKLQKHAKGSMWEKNALQKLLGIGEKYDPNYASKAEVAKQQAEEAKKFLKEITDSVTGEKGRTDAVVNENMKRLRETLQIADDAWIKKGDDRTIDSVTEKMLGQLRNGEQLETDRTKLSPRELLEKASGGSAMRGILVTRIPEDCIATRRTVLEAPDSVELKSPISSQKEDVVDLSSKKQSDNFSRSIETMGHSMAASVSGGVGLFRGEVGGSEGHQDEKQEDKKDSTSTTYLSRVMYFYVPTAICELKESELKLCEDALAKLQELETVIEFGDSDDLNQESCKDFLRIYGSHVNVGHIEFGGIYLWTSTFYGETTSSTTKVQSLVQDALAAHVSASYGVPVIGPSVGGSFSGSFETGTGEGKGKHEQSDLSNTTLKTDKKGGPQEVSDPVRWKAGIMKYNETWAVIDRGCREEDRIGIWKIIVRNHTKDFSNTEQLAATLQKAWKSMGGLGQMDDCSRILNAKRTMDEILDDVYKWKDDASLASNAVCYVKRVCDKRVTGKVMARTLKDKTLSKFLDRFMEIKDEYSAKDLALMKMYLQKLLDAAGAHEFPLKDDISLWLKF